MQSIPAVSTNSPIASLIPVIFVILVGMAKELYLECKRWKEDKRINSAPVNLLSEVNDKDELVYREDIVANLRVGDIIQLKDDDYVPADCIILRSQQKNGQAFIQTDALDGERNFKSKFALVDSQ